MGVQYYRPPFPDSKYWDEDMSRIRDAGIEAVQLWACWGWIESKPGEFRFDDYDTLIQKASERGLKVIISTIAEIQPFWIERVIPEATMIDHMGNRVISSLRTECNVGLTPGGCTDNPVLRERMIRFLKKIGTRYGKRKEVIAWDCWNENRWHIQADGWICHCPATLKAFRDFLKEKYGDIDGLNRAWQRRYADWEDVFPGKLPRSPYTEMMEFLRFLTYRAGGIMRFRAEALRSAGVRQMILAHSGESAVFSDGAWDGTGKEQPLCRGNDWDVSSVVDGFGCSYFPGWSDLPGDDDFGIRLESIRSSVQGKMFWIGELQGGMIRSGGLRAQKPLPAKPQQRWVWSGYGRGAKIVLFWCWRDEVFGCESGIAGISGNDGLASERLAALAESSKFLKEHTALLDGYQQDTAKVGVLFEPSNYYLEWTQDGKVERVLKCITGYLKALENLNVPYEVVESSRLGVLDTLDFLILPFPLVISDQVSEKLISFVERGGTLLTEGDLGAFDPLGFYRYPGKDRTLASRFGVSPCKERQLIKEENLTITFGKKRFLLKASLWLTPLSCSAEQEVMAKDEDGNILAVANSAGKGKVYAFGTFPGAAYGTDKKSDRNFTDFINCLLSAHHCKSEICVSFKERQKEDQLLYWRSGKSGSERLLFVINPSSEEKIVCEAPAHFFKGDTVSDLRKHSQSPLVDSHVKGRKKVCLEVEAEGWAVFCL